MQSKRSQIFIIFALGIISIFESRIAERIGLLQMPGIPLDLDVSLLVLTYLGLGFYLRNTISLFIFNPRERKVTIGTVLSCIICAISIILNINDLYYFDMKPMFYHEYISAILVPFAFGILLCRLSYYLCKINSFPGKVVNKALSIIGQCTLPIMFMHLIINGIASQFFNYGIVLFTLIGVVVPVILCHFLSGRVWAKRIFGIPKLDLI